MSKALEIAVSEVPGDVPVAVMRISGDLDSQSHAQLETKAGELITAGKNRIVLDLGAITFMGSAGLRAMHGIAGRLKTVGGGGQLKLVNPSDAATRVMKTLGFDQFFDIHASVDEAVASFRRR